MNPYSAAIILALPFVLLIQNDPGALLLGLVGGILIIKIWQNP